LLGVPGGGGEELPVEVQAEARAPASMMMMPALLVVIDGAD
jgi:hypothetical protein